MNIGKAIFFLIIGGSLVGGTLALAKTSAALDKLDISVERFWLKKGTDERSLLLQLLKNLLSFKIIFSADLKLSNPSDTDLELTHPYLKLFYNKKQIAFSPSAIKRTHVIKSRQTVQINNLEIEFLSKTVLAVIPDFVKYIAKRIGGAASTRKAMMQVIAEVNGNSGVKEAEVDL